MRAVLDTNVVISGTLIRGGNEDRIVRAWQRGEFELVLSPQILEELGRALFYEKLRGLRWMSESEVVALLETLAAESVMVSGQRRVKVSRDPEDDKVLAAALEAGAQYVVTGDRDLLDLDRHRDVEIVSPAGFLAVLRRRERGGRSQR